MIPYIIIATHPDNTRPYVFIYHDICHKKDINFVPIHKLIDHLVEFNDIEYDSYDELAADHLDAELINYDCPFIIKYIEDDVWKHLQYDYTEFMVLYNEKYIKAWK